MYKIQLYCDGCKNAITDRQFPKSRILTLEKFPKGPWISFMEPVSAKTLIKIAICPECLKKIDVALEGHLDDAFDKPTEKEMEEYFNEDATI